MYAMLDACAAHPRSHAAMARARHVEPSRRVVTFTPRSRCLLEASNGFAFGRSARFRLADRGDHRGAAHERDGRRARAARAWASADASAEESPSRPPLRVLFAAGGTGGHVFPAVAVADALVAASDRHALPDDREVHVSFAGTAGRQEARLVPAAGYELHLVPAVSLARPLSSPGNVVKNLFILPFRLAWCLWRALALLSKLRPHVVVGTGGYVSAPVCFAAALRDVPLCVQEQNARPGMANRLLAPLADCVFVAFRAAAGALLRAKTHRIHGNPVRVSLRSIARADARRKVRFWFSMACGGGYKGQLGKDFVLVILGGSLGASAINRAAARAIPELLATHPNLWVVWQTGADGYAAAVAAVAGNIEGGSDTRCVVGGATSCKFPRLAVVPFIDEMDAAYGASKNVGALLGSTVAHSSLSEVMRLDGDHIIVDYITEFEGTDLADISTSMRQIKADFSNEPEHQRDVQIVIDENQLNYAFFSMFYADKPFSLTEKLLEMIPEWLEPAAFLVKAVMNAQTFSPFFPELRRYGSRRIDLRCSFDKQTLLDGELEQMQMSQLKFKDGNRVNLDLHFGCSTWLYQDEVKIPAMEEFMNFVLDLYDDNEEKWEKHRSFYISMDANVALDFSEDAKTQKLPGAADWLNKAIYDWTKKEDVLQLPKMSEHVPLIFGRVLEFNPNIRELKVFSGKTELHDEASQLNRAINDARTHEFWENPMLQPIFELFFGHTIPMAPYPTVEYCLGLNPKDSHMTIKEGLAIMSYDYKVLPATRSCLFSMEENKLKKEAKRLERYTNSPIGWTERKFNKLMKVADEKILQKIPPLDIPSLMNDPTIKKITKLATDDEMQKNIKKGVKMGMEKGEKILKGLGDIGKVFEPKKSGEKKKGGLFNLFQN